MPNHFAPESTNPSAFSAVCIFEPLRDDEEFLTYSERKAEYARQLDAIQAGIEAQGLSSLPEYEAAIGRMVAHVRDAFPAEAVSLNSIRIPGNGTVVATVEAWGAGKFYGTYDRMNPTWEYVLTHNGEVFCDGVNKS